MYFKSQWKLALLLKNDADGMYGRSKSKKAAGEGFGDIYDSVLGKINTNLMAHDFVMNAALIPYTEDYLWTGIQNAYISVMATLAKTLPYFLEADFTKASPENMKGRIHEVLCAKTKIDSAGDKKQLIIKVMKLGEDSDALNDYERVVSKFISQTDATIASMGDADSDYWDKVSIIAHKSRTSFCKIAMAKAFQDVATLKKKAYQDTHTYIASKMLDCDEKTRLCNPVYD